MDDPSQSFRALFQRLKLDEQKLKKKRKTNFKIILNFHVTTKEKILQAALSSTISIGGIFAANGDGMFVSFHFDFDEVDVVVVAGDVHVDVIVVFDVF